MLGQLLCDEPPPPPPNIPTLEDDVSAETLREQLEQHRANPVCASCHESMDPIGFALGVIAFAGWGWPRGEHPRKQVTAGHIPRTEPEAT